MLAVFQRATIMLSSRGRHAIEIDCAQGKASPLFKPYSQKYRPMVCFPLHNTGTICFTPYCTVWCQFTYISFFTV